MWGRGLGHDGLAPAVRVALGIPDESGLELGAVHRRPHRGRAVPHDPAVRQADPQLPADADDPAGDAEDPGEVQGQERSGVPSEDDAGDDGPLQEDRTNPFASCLPILLQSPVFFALFQVLQQHAARRDRRPPADRPDHAGVARSSRSRRSSALGCRRTFVGADATSTSRSSRPCSIVLMSASTFTTQRQLMRKNMPDRCAGQPVHEAAEDHDLPAADLLRDLRHELPDRCPALLADHERLVDGPAVLRDPADAGPGLAAERAYEARQKKRGKTIKKLHIPGLGDTTTDQPDVQDALPEAPDRAAAAAEGQEAQQARSERWAGEGGAAGAAGLRTAGSDDGSVGSGSSTPQDAPADAPANGLVPPGRVRVQLDAGGAARPAGQRQQPKRQKQKPTARPKQPQGQVKREPNSPTTRRPDQSSPSPDPA